MSLDARETATLRADAEPLGLRLDDATVTRIGGFIDLLGVWNQRFHLTGERDRERLLRKHVVDSLTAIPLLPATGSMVDIGTGAGFPGMVLACCRPDLEVVLVEARRRPCSFLFEVARSLGLSAVRVLESRAEDAPWHISPANLVISRAIRLDQLLRLAMPLLAANGSVVAMQTPRTSREDVERLARPLGLEVEEIRDYRLPSDESRRLIRLTQVCAPA